MSRERERDGLPPHAASRESENRRTSADTEGRDTRRETGHREESRANATIKGTGRAAWRSWPGDSRVIFVLYEAYGIKWQRRTFCKYEPAATVKGTRSSLRAEKRKNVDVVVAKRRRCSYTPVMAIVLFNVLLAISRP